MFFFREQAPQYHSKFGGLWIDRKDAADELARKRTKGVLGPALADKAARFMRDGYLILPQAVAPDLATQIATGMTAAFAHGDDRLRYDTDGAVHHVLTAGTDPRGKRIIEAHAVLPPVLDAFASRDIVEFLSAIFEEPPRLSQTLMFQMGSEQGYHRDTTFVRFDEPMRMVGCWIALEDVQQGSGELRYLVGSHRLPDYPFSHGKKDGIGIPADELHASLQWVIDESQKAGLSEQTFHAKKGDALIWHADLAHGGSPIADAGLTRQSVVGHLSPLSVGRSMHAGADVKRKHGPLYYSSTYYDLNDVKH